MPRLPASRRAAVVVLLDRVALTLQRNQKNNLGEQTEIARANLTTPPLAKALSKRLYFLPQGILQWLAVHFGKYALICKNGRKDKASIFTHTPSGFDELKDSEAERWRVHQLGKV